MTAHALNCGCSRHHEQRAAEWHGWTPANTKRCPRSLAGRRCLIGYPSYRRCACQQFQWPLLLDHVRRWKTATGEPILSTEPYDLHQCAAAVLDEFRSELADLGLTVTNLGTDRSPWYPGYTTLLVIRREITP